MNRNVFLNAYMVNNFGDDLFISILCNRYPKYRFHTISSYNVNPMPPNLIIHNPPFFFKAINKVFRDWFQHDLNIYSFIQLKIRKYKCCVKIVGSGYMQKNRYQKPKNSMIEKRFYNRNSYVIGCNFGPYYTSNYLNHYVDQFKKLSGITFRDHYSFELFKELSNALEAPDIVFGLNIKKYIKPKKRNSIMISLMNLEYGHYSDRFEYTDDYKRVMLEAIKRFLNDGFNVTLLSLCDREEDKKIAIEFQKTINDSRIKILSYPDRSMDDILFAISESEHLVSTRFHSFVLGVMFKCNVLPISYNEKIENTIKEIGFNGKTISLKQLKQINDEGIVDMLKYNMGYELDSSVSIKAKNHFLYLDSLLGNTDKRKGGCK